MEAEITGFLRLRGRQAFPVAARFFQQHKGAPHIGLQKSAGIVNGPIHMAFGRQMHDGVRFENLKGGAHCCGIRNIGVQKMVARMISHISQ